MIYAISASSYMSWYKAMFELAFATSTGHSFEQFIVRCLKARHVGFLNPAPKGPLGDGGCDGVTADGLISYAMYGYLPNRGENELAKKVDGDFARAISEWPKFSTWRFVSNVQFGPKATKVVLDLRGRHGAGSNRTIDIEILDAEGLWDTIVKDLTEVQLNELFPGVPHAANVKLQEMTVLLASLGGEPGTGDDGRVILPVPPEKMDYNQLGRLTRQEFQEGRLQAERITRWYERQSDPTLRDQHGRRFNEIYHEAVATRGRVIEHIYIALGGTDFRLDTGRANAVYAVTSYFFDECDIFESVPAEASEG